jgi:hypothetical protein
MATLDVTTRNWKAQFGTEFWYGEGTIFTGTVTYKEKAAVVAAVPSPRTLTRTLRSRRILQASERHHYAVRQQSPLNAASPRQHSTWDPK